MVVPRHHVLGAKVEVWTDVRACRAQQERLVFAGDTVRVEDLPAEVPGSESTAPAVKVEAPGGASPATLREFKEIAERAFLVQKLRENGWNISKTAELLETPRSNLYKKLEAYGIKQEIDG